MLAADRERGTISLIGAQPTTVSSIVTLRIGLRFAVVVGVTLLAALVGVVAAGVPFAMDTWSRVGIWTLATGLYGAFWFAVAMAIAARGASGATTALAAGGAWLVLVVIVPAAVNVVTGALYPMPSRVQMVQVMREASDEASARGSTLLAQYFEAHPDLLPDGGQHVADAAAIRAAVADEVQRLVRPVAETFDAQATHQRLLAARLRFLSPALLLRGVLDDVTGTGAVRYETFTTQVTAFHDAWREHFTVLAVARQPVESIAAVPVFTFVDESAGDVARRACPALAVLAAGACVLGGIFVHSMRRYSCAR
ncbi:MAG: hypothetical protein ABS36_18185 [Acidobacteria bacterium SCN 69-37]|nr:MAG: hypothetical protein ABS36_18185 [Acidobacteria bacterium SCN 69-37]